MFSTHTYKKINKFVLYLFTFTLYSNTIQAQCTAVSESDSLALVEFYYAIGGDLLEQNGGWLEGPISEWTGITLSDDGCSVKEINLLGQGLQGFIPDLNLPNLEVLNLSYNQLNNEIPNFSHLENLRTLNLTGSQLSGEIPDFSNLPNLKNLYLDENQLSGEIPDFSNLPNVLAIYLLGNQLSGSIPDFPNLPSLKNLYLADNQLSGEIPDFSNLPSLKILGFYKNQLSGEVPNFSSVPNLKTLYLNDNQLSGEIPDFSNISLHELYLNDNQLSGEIPDFNDISLYDLYLDGNQLSGSIPSFSNLPNLSTLSLTNNQLSGEVPNFDNVPNLVNLYLSGNELSGEIPNLPNLFRLDLSNNQLTGVFPANLNNLNNLILLDLSNNQLSGSIPALDSLINLNVFKICPNNLTGNIPSFNASTNLNIGDIDYSCVIAAQTTGTTYADLNGNCIKEENEPTIPNAIIATTDSTSYAFSDESGFYTLKTDTGIQSFNAFVPNYLWEQTCLDYPEAYTINPQNYEDSIGGFDFGFRPLVECPLMMVEVGTPFLRRCFTNTYTIHYCNTGTAAAEEAAIHLSLGEDIIPLESSITYEEDTENYLVFNLGTIGIGECGSFTLTDSLSCDAVLGSTACMEAFAFPNDLCFEDTNLWDGADLEINASCVGDSVVFEIVNTGEDMLEESEYRMYEDDVVTITNTLFLMAGEVRTLSYVATGQAFRMTAQQTPNHPTSKFVTAVVELCGADSNMASLGFVNTQSNINYSYFYDINCQEIIGSYDPNDKTVTPKGVGDEHRITDTQELEYKIRFQNIGNDTAFQVIVIDTIDTNFLNLNSLKLGVSSHDYRAEVKNGNVLIFTFENILLVDSATNEMASNGFVMFKISQKAGNQRDDLIQNEAAIYFDYNQPVITNKAFNTIGLPHFTTAVPLITQIQGTIPASVFYENGQLHIKLSVVASNTRYSFTLYDALGRFITQENKLFVPNHELSAGNLTAGIYVFEIQATNGKKTKGKFIVQ